MEGTYVGDFHAVQDDFGELVEPGSVPIIREPLGDQLKAVEEGAFGETRCEGAAFLVVVASRVESDEEVP